MRPYRGRLVVGRISDAFGLRGEVKVLPEADILDLLLHQIRELQVDLGPLGTRTLRVEEVRPGPKGTLIFRFTGIESRTLAERLKGRDLLVDREVLGTPERGEYFVVDLEGLEVIDERGEPIGVLKTVLKNPGADLFVIERFGGKEIHLPAVSAFVLGINLEEGRIRVRIPEGLEEL